MSVVHGTDIDINLYFDFETEVPCEVGVIETNTFSDCHNKAEWKMVMKCCAKGLVVCDPHLQRDIKLYDWFEGFATCLICYSDKFVTKGDMPYNYYRL